MELATLLLLTNFSYWNFGVFIEICHCTTYYGQTQLLLQTHRKQLHYKIKYSCAVVCWIRPRSRVSLDSVPRHTWNFTSKCLLFGKQSSLMAGRDCLFEDGLYVCDDWWWTAGLLSCSKQFFLHFCYTILVGIHNTSTAAICRNHWQSLPYTGILFWNEALSRKRILITKIRTLDLCVYNSTYYTIIEQP